MRAARYHLLAGLVVLGLQGCVAVTVVDTAVGVTSTVVGAAVDVTGAVVGGAVDLVTPEDGAEDAVDDAADPN